MIQLVTLNTGHVFKAEKHSGWWRCGETRLLIGWRMVEWIATLGESQMAWQEITVFVHDSFMTDFRHQLSSIESIDQLNCVVCGWAAAVKVSFL